MNWKNDRNEEETSIKIEPISAPKGGGSLKGMGGETGVSAFTGESSLRIPLFVTPCRDCEPSLTLSYSSASGNGLFGMGFSLDLPEISRRLGKGVPRYDDAADVFILSGVGRLVETGLRRENEYEVRTYIPREGTDFSLIEYWKEKNTSFWRITGRNNEISVFGATAESRVKNTENSSVFSWKITESLLNDGNRIIYNYHDCNLPETIRYGNYFDEEGKENWAFCIRFLYEEGRPDVFSRYDAGFPRRWKQRCGKVVMLHRFYDQEKPVRETAFTYDAAAGISLLTGIKVTGFLAGTGEPVVEESLPEMRFTYTPYEPFRKGFVPMSISDGTPLQTGMQGFTPVDLYGDGIDGLLYTGGHTALYCRALGKGQYDVPQRLDNFPVERDLNNAELFITSIEGNGRYELVAAGRGRSGFYPIEEGSFGPFVPFEKFPNEYMEGETADLQGDRRHHLMITGPDWLRYYPSIKQAGYAPAVVSALPEKFAHRSQNSPEQAILFADIFGDGLQHRVRVRNGEVTCFPNLGYGSFGEEINIKNAPLFPEGLDSSRLFFSDLDGSGTEDIIYICHDRIEVYWNRSGIRFEGPFYTELPEPYSCGDRISFADVSGTGSKSIIFEKRAGGRTSCYFLETAPVKPYLLHAVDCGNGTQVEWTYESAALLSLSDRLGGTPWELRPPFPVQVVTAMRRRDECNRTSTFTEYAYRNGFHDTLENEFKGFGFVRRTETSQGEGWKGRVVKTWYNTPCSCSGCSTADPFAPRMEVLAAEGECDMEGAKRALWGRPIREERYEIGRETPAETVQTGYFVRQLAAPGTDMPGAYYVSEREEIHVRYEEDPLDPAITHSFNLIWDEYGNVLRSADICYPRRRNTVRASETHPALLDAQAGLCAVMSDTVFLNRKMPGRHLGIVSEIREYELQIAEPDDYYYYTWDQLLERTASAIDKVIPYGTAFVSGIDQARLTRWHQRFYWSDEENAAPLGETGSRCLPHHSRDAVFPDDYGPYRHVYDDTVFEQECGYEAEDGYWWAVHAVTCYGGPRLLYLPVSQEYPDGRGKISVSYDYFALMPVRMMETADGQNVYKTEAVLNYEVMQYEQITDPNGTVTQLLYDCFGRVAALSDFGTENEMAAGGRDLSAYIRRSASFEEVLEHPEQYLQNAGAFYFYDPAAWQNRHQPPCVIEVYGAEFADGTGMKRKLKCTVTFCDGTGRELLHMTGPVDGSWMVRDRTVWSRGDAPACVYPSYSVNTAVFPETEDSVLPTCTEYDWKERPVRILTPESLEDRSAGYCMAETEYSAYACVKRGQNSLLPQSPYYKAFLEAFPEEPTDSQTDQRAVLERSCKFEGLAEADILDNRGYVIGHYQDTASEEFSFYERDSAGRARTMADPRLRRTGCVNLKTGWDMCGREVFLKSSDAGDTLHLWSNHGEEVRYCDSSGARKRFLYDGLFRLVETRVEGVGTTERREYGGAGGDYAKRNLCGRLTHRYDQAGLTEIISYTFRGLEREKCRRLHRDYAVAADWSKEQELEDVRYREAIFYDAGDRILTHEMPDGSCISYNYDVCGRLLEVKTAGDQPRVLISHIRYDAGDRRIETVYGNGVRDIRTFNAVTCRLETMESLRDTGEVIRRACYTFDPGGNLARIRDCMSSVLYGHAQRVEPVRDYCYDAAGRLISATGRECAGHVKDLSDLVTFTQTYTYDAGGNMVRKRHSSSTRTTVLDMEMEAHSNRLSAAGDVTGIEYDGCGNMTGFSPVRPLEWDFDGHLSRAVLLSRGEGKEEDDQIAVYDADGDCIQRVTRVLGPEQTRKVSRRIALGDCVFYCDQDGNRFQSELRICMEDMQIASLWKGADGIQRVSCQLGDHLGSVSLRLDEDAKIISFEEYAPFGEAMLCFQSRRDVYGREYRFCSREYVAATGLYDFGARYYCCAWGRMISADAAGYADPKDARTLNLFIYCMDNPMSRRDPDGHCSGTIFYGRDQTARALGEAGITGFAAERIYGSDCTPKGQQSFAQKWSALQTDDHSTIVILQHGSPTSIRKVNISELDPAKKASELILFSCNTANPVEGGQNMAQQMLHRFSNVGRVIGARGFHSSFQYKTKRKTGTGYGETWIHSTQSAFRGRRLAVQPSFVMYTRGELGRTVETPLNMSYNSMGDLIRDARSRKPQQGVA